MKRYFGGAGYILPMLCFSLFFLFSGPLLADGDEREGKAHLKKGKELLDSGKYADAVQRLSIAYRELPILGDYALLWLSKAHYETGNFDKSEASIKELFERYPDSPLRKKARFAEIKNAMHTSEDKASDLFESYIKDYPEDREMRFLFGQFLKKRGEIERAKSVFKGLYLSAGTLSKMAYGELDPMDFTPQELLERASNLITAMEFKEAESVLREALLRGDGRLNEGILKKLGLSLFRQKRYKEAAEVYAKAKDHYSKARSLYRAGERDAFNSTLRELISMGDIRAGSLLILSALSKRREGNSDEALKIYREVKTKYPAQAEDSLWGIGWTYYRTGDYQKALNAFTDLHNTYGGSKYLYWKAKCIEKTGGDAGHVYKQLTRKERDFYSILAHIKIGRSPAKVKYEAYEPAINLSITERADILMELGMKKDAAAELIHISRKTSNVDELVLLCSKLQGIGEYRKSINLMTRLPDREQAHDILYPLAYWPVIEEASARYGIDPFIVLSVAREESRFDPEARSVAGALGLMQIMPQTAYNLDRRLNLNITTTEHIYDVRININLGSYYLSSLFKEFGSLPIALAAYNAGEDVVRKWLKKDNYKSYDEFIEDIPYTETRNYVKRVITTYSEYLRFTGEKDAPFEIKLRMGDL